jgi:hypothetical protein
MWNRFKLDSDSGVSGSRNAYEAIVAPMVDGLAESPFAGCLESGVRLSIVC